MPVSSFFRFLVWIALSGMLLACESDKMKETEFNRQQSIFLLSLELVEFAGRTLQSPDLGKETIDTAMIQMDQGLEKAFSVDPEFLKRLDVRLPKLYAEMFIQGIENYRLGVESADREKQLEGLRLLSLWSKFWIAEKQNIQNQLISLNGTEE